jgi:hypothetical protein
MRGNASLNLDGLGGSPRRWRTSRRQLRGEEARRLDRVDGERDRDLHAAHVAERPGAAALGVTGRAPLLCYLWESAAHGAAVIPGRSVAGDPGFARKRGSMRRRWPVRQESTGAAFSCIACAVRFWSGAIRQIRRRPKTHSSLQSPSRSSRRRAVSSCAQRSRWRSSITQRTDPRTLTPCSRLRSRAFRRPRNFPRSRKRKCSSQLWRHEPVERAGDLRVWHRAADRECPLISSVAKLGAVGCLPIPV